MRKRIVLGKIGQVRENVLARSLFARKNLSPETPGRKLRQKSEGDTTRGAVRSTGSPPVVRQTLDEFNVAFKKAYPEGERGQHVVE